jgi:hypothetical protein
MATEQTEQYLTCSFADPKSEYRLEISQTPLDEDPVGVKINEPTGRVICEECDAAAHNIDEIPHDSSCPQRFVRSGWWVDHFDGI